MALTGLERQMWKHLWCKVHLEGLYCIIPLFKAPQIRVLPWLFHGLKLDIAVVQAQSFTSPQSFRLPLNFSRGFENSFRIKLAVAMKLWHFNRNHQMTFKHDPVVQSCQNWFEVKKPLPPGNIVEESHKMQMVPLNRTYIDLFMF